MNKLDQEGDVTIQNKQTNKNNKKSHNCNNTSENGRSQMHQASNTSKIAHWLTRKDDKEMEWVKFFKVGG